MDKLDEAFLYSEAIDVTTYGRQRDKLREELAFRTYSAAGVRPVGPGVPDYKQRMQELFFPEGIAYNGNRFNRTAATAPLFRGSAPSESADEKIW